MESIYFYLQVCDVLSTTLNQEKTVVVLALISLFSSCMGHSVVNVKRGWREEVVLWIMISQGTGMLNHLILFYTPVSQSRWDF